MTNIAPFPQAVRPARRRLGCTFERAAMITAYCLN